MLFFCLAMFFSIADYGRWAYAAGLLFVFFINGALWFGVVAGRFESFALKAAFVAITIHVLMPLGMCLALPLDADYMFPWGEHIFEKPLAAALAYLVSPVAITLVLVLFSPFATKRGRYDLRTLIDIAGPKFELFLLLAAALKFSIWFTVLSPGNPVFYLARVLTYALSVVPFFVGFCALKYKRATLAWLVVIGLSLLIALKTGSRGPAFYPALYFMIGFFLGLRNNLQRLSWGLLAGVPAAIFIATLGVYIGLARDVVGRSDAGALFSSKSTVSEAAKDSNVAREMMNKMQEGVAFKVFQRLTLWPLTVVPTMTPDPVDYRGFDDFHRELLASVQLGMIVGKLNTGGIYFSNWYLKPYGFAVHADSAGLISNVEMPVFTDAFTRGGWIAGGGFTFLAFAVIYIFEQVLRRYLLPKRIAVLLIMLPVLATIAAIRVHMDPLVSVIRLTVLYGCFSLVCFLAFDYAWMRFGFGKRGRK